MQKIFEFLVEKVNISPNSVLLKISIEYKKKLRVIEGDQKEIADERQGRRWKDRNREGCRKMTWRRKGELTHIRLAAKEKQESKMNAGNGHKLCSETGAATLKAIIFQREKCVSHGGA